MGLYYTLWGDLNELGIRGIERLVIYTLYYLGKGQVSISMSDLADACGISKDKLKICLKMLVSSGILSIKYDPGHVSDFYINVLPKHKCHLKLVK